jgi:hypothetical protein
MPGDDFSKDMDSYLKKRNSSDDYKYLDAEQTTPEAEPEPIAEEFEDEPEMDEPQEQKGFLAKLKGMFKSSEPVDEPYVEENPHAECRDDIKALGKIAIDVVKALPHPELMDFKDSQQYQNLRTILKKYKLIKLE